MYGIDTKKEFQLNLSTSKWIKLNDYYVQHVSADVLDHEDIITGYPYAENEENYIDLKKEIDKIFEVGTVENFVVYKAKEVLNLDIISLIGII